MTKGEQYRALYNEGMSYSEIARVFGVTRQAVRESVTKDREIIDGYHESGIRNVKYIGLRDWMLENRVSITELADRCGVGRLYPALTGKGGMTKCTIDKILAATGLTYEECFKEVDIYG